MTFFYNKSGVELGFRALFGKIIAAPPGSQTVQKKFWPVATWLVQSFIFRVSDVFEPTVRFFSFVTCPFLVLLLPEIQFSSSLRIC